MATVKKVAATADAARAEWNAKQTLKTQNAKSGGTARLMANATRYLDKNEPRVSDKKTVKINSNPVKPGKTVIGPLAGKGGAGLGGMFGIKNR
jgi:hypothetical protein